MSTAIVRRFVRQGDAARLRGALHTAKKFYKKALDLDPHDPLALSQSCALAVQFTTNDRRFDAKMRELFEMALAADPNNNGLLHNYGLFFVHRGEPARAYPLMQRSVAVQPNQLECWQLLGDICDMLGLTDEAERAYKRALSCDVTSSGAHFSRASLRLARGDYLGGFKDYEARWDETEFKAKYARKHMMRLPWWGGDPLHGTLLIHQEQGAGDAIQMSRYITMAKSKCDRLIVEVIKGLVPLFRAWFPDVEIVDRDSELPRIDAQLPMFSLPYTFRTTLDSIPSPPSTFPLAPEPDRVGLCWNAGVLSVAQNMRRNMPFEALAPILDRDALTFQSLQWGFDVSAPLDPCPTGSFLDTATAIARCALVVTVDTSIAHIAGSLGVPTWVMLHHHADWRWLKQRTDSPWYPSTRLFRQPTPGDWDGVVADVNESLARFLGPSDPVAPGSARSADSV